MSDAKFGLINKIGKEKALDFETKVYKFSNYENFINSLNNQYLFFNKIIGWPDKWEIPGNLIKSINSECSALFASVVNDNNKFYGNCFSLDYRCDAFWNRYSRNKTNDAVCFSTKVKKILLVPEFKGYVNSGVIGKVIYKDIKYVDDFVANQDNTPYVLEYLLPFIKRENFSYEKEVRFILEGKNDDCCLKIFTDMSKLIDVIYISPNMCKYKKDKLRKLVTRKIPNAEIIEYDAYQKETLEIKDKKEFENKIRMINNGRLSTELINSYSGEYVKLLNINETY